VGELSRTLEVRHISDVRRFRARLRGPIRAYRAVAIVVLNTLICFVCLELVSTAITSIRDYHLRPQSESSDARSGSPYYATQEWSAQYWREFNASRMQAYHPYVIWRRRAFAGETINVDAAGVRLTPGANCGSGARKVFVFGSSTVWGTGAPDWGTLPAYLQTELQAHTNNAVCVVNYGESAYVSTQSLFQLLLLLQSGSVPNLVLFYEGLNDAYAAYQSGIANAHENYDQLAASFEGGGRPAEEGAVAYAVKRTSLFRVSRNLLAGLTHHLDEPSRLKTYQSLGIDSGAVATGVAKEYLNNYAIVDALAKKYGFEYRFIWPPYIRTGHKQLVAAEQTISGRIDPALDRLYQSVYKRVSASAAAHPRLVDMTNVFDGSHDLLWIDEVHVTPVGNRMLAAAIAAMLTTD